MAGAGLALLFLRAEAEGFALCPAPALQTKVFQYREGVLGAQPRLRARPAAGDPGHPTRLPLPERTERPRRTATAQPAGGDTAGHGGDSEGTESGEPADREGTRRGQGRACRGREDTVGMVDGDATGTGTLEGHWREGDEDTVGRGHLGTRGLRSW
uniref:Uncharacterized protein n=1 Tax=Catharus ustulatus TaxID=91951 RepID=A0A8C3Y275_CATUS